MTIANESGGFVFSVQSFWFWLQLFRPTQFTRRTPCTPWVRRRAHLKLPFDPFIPMCASSQAGNVVGSPLPETQSGLSLQGLEHFIFWSDWTERLFLTSLPPPLASQKCGLHLLWWQPLLKAGLSTGISCGRIREI